MEMIESACGNAFGILKFSILSDFEIRRSGFPHQSLNLIARRSTHHTLRSGP